MINLYGFMCYPRIVEFRGTVERNRKVCGETNLEKGDKIMLNEHHVSLLPKDAASVILLISYQESPR